MKYIGMPCAMWLIFENSFQKKLTEIFKIEPNTAKIITKNAKAKYKEIIADLPEFEKGDRFITNTVNCSMLCAFVLCMPTRPEVEKLTEYYTGAMMTPAMKIFCRMSGKQTFSKKKIQSLKKTEKARFADRNPFSWNMKLFEYPDGSGYEARFSQCGICNLTKKYGLFDLTPAMCKLDYTMSEAGKTSTFIREKTIASGGPYCDCGYKKK